MRTEFGALAPDDTLSLAARKTVQHAQADLPVAVTDHGCLVGLVGLDDVTNLLRVTRVRAQRPSQAVSA